MKINKKFLAQAREAMEAKAQETKAAGWTVVAGSSKKRKRHLILGGPSEARATQVAHEVVPAPST